MTGRIELYLIQYHATDCTLSQAGSSGAERKILGSASVWLDINT
jgi:hypothetical protein